MRMARIDQIVELSARTATLEGHLVVPHGARGLVLFVHGSGSSRHSPWNRVFAERLQLAGFGTLLVDLLTHTEEHAPRVTRDLHFDIVFFADRVAGVTDWLRADPRTANLPLGYFGASTGAAAALLAAVRRPHQVRAVVSAGGRPDLAAPWLSHVLAPTLLIVGENDRVVVGFNRRAIEALTGEKELVVVPGAGHLFEEEGALERAAEFAAGWFIAHLAAGPYFHIDADGRLW